MNLSEVYLFFSSPLWLFFWTIFLYGAVIEILSWKQDNNTHFFDAIVSWLDSYKSKAICVLIVNIIICLTIFFGSRQIIIGLGCDDIQIMPSGNYCYYVCATNEKDKTYTLPANIEKVSNNKYIVHNIYFKNGGYLYFSDPDYFAYGEKESSIDQNENHWDIELTSKKAYHEKVTETKPFNAYGLILPCISIITILLSTILYIIQIREKDF